MLRNLATSVILHGRVITTEAKAKTVRSEVEKLISLGKRGDLHARRQAAAYMLSPDAVKKLFGEIAPRYQERSGGYVRILKAGLRLSAREVRGRHQSLTF
jgi:large subunit ribosomal protein L17